MDLVALFSNQYFDTFADLVGWMTLGGGFLFGFVFVVNLIFSFIDYLIGGKRR